MVEFKRYNYPGRISKKTGKIICSEHYEIYCYVNGKEFAQYESKEDVLYLNAKYLGNEFKRTYSERIANCKYKNEFNAILNELETGENTKLSEYCNM